MTTDGPAFPDAPRYPTIDDYGFLGDGLGAALVSRAGSIDWACLRRIDDGSTFGRLLDWDTAGHCRFAPTAEAEVTRRYLGNTCTLETTFRTATGAARVIDLLALRRDGYPEGRLVRIAEGIEGTVELGLVIAARYDYGLLRPWVRTVGDGVHTLIGGDDGLLVWSDVELHTVDRQDLVGTTVVGPGERWRLSLDVRPPHTLDGELLTGTPTPDEVDGLVEATAVGWSQIHDDVDVTPDLRRSALVLRALGNADTGAIAAAATTSIPEVVGGDSNWDYRYTWIRDSWLTVRALADLGDVSSADRFRRFVERSAAGQVDELQIAFGVGGEHSLSERTLDHLEGWRGSKPVRIGNAAAGQLQLDAYGELLELAWLWYERGHVPDDDWWHFLVDVANHACDRWRDPDSGIWEVRGEQHHFVHSKAFAWVALDRGVRLADALDRDHDAEVQRWRTEAAALRAEVLERGVDPKRGCFVDALDGTILDAAVLLLPTVEFVAWDDPVMVATVDAVLDGLVVDGFVRRRQGWDDEGAFLPCTFWLVECLAHLGRLDEARAFFDRATGTANDLGLFAEEYQPRTRMALGNFPQALTHLGHINAALALREAAR
ncbi:MAG: glycoside hydrolase 15-related [Actinomycetia bacterium]|nr:glycoside hydrolase 15-related [Actinomycetes bacterium]